MPRFAIVIALTSLLAASHATAQTSTAVFETTLEGYELSSAGDLLVDPAGNTFLLGSHHPDGTHLDPFVVKLDPEGRVLWSFEAGTDDHDQAEGLALDSRGDLWVTGWTDAAEFPVRDALDATLTGFRDAFLIRLDGDDGSLLYGTFLGGDYTDWAFDIAIDDDDHVHLTGASGSTDFPTTANALQGAPSFPSYSYQDAFVVEFAADGGELLYGTYFGGLTDDWGQRIALDGNGDVIVGGRTDADDLPLVTPFDAAPNDLFLARFSASDHSLLFSSYLGGSDVDRLADLSVTASGDVVIAGSTRSVDFPTTTGAFQEDFVGGIDACEVPFGGDFNCSDFFVSRVTPDGSGLVWSTYLGGTTVDQPRALALDPDGRAHVIGHTSSPDFPLAPRDELGASVVLARLGADGRRLEDVHSLDSGSANGGNGIAIGADGSVTFTATVGVPARIRATRIAGARVTGTGDDPNGPRPPLVLEQNQPNPFNPRTTIRFRVPGPSERTQVDLDVFDARGRRIRRLVSGVRTPGRHEVVWDGQDDEGRPVASGVYTYRLRAGQQTRARRMILLR